LMLTVKSSMPESELQDCQYALMDSHPDEIIESALTKCQSDRKCDINLYEDIHGAFAETLKPLEDSLKNLNEYMDKVKRELNYKPEDYIYVEKLQTFYKQRVKPLRMAVKAVQEYPWPKNPTIVKVPPHHDDF